MSFILASKSEIRKRLLEAAGFDFSVAHSANNEHDILTESPKDRALMRAISKATDVAMRNRGRTVVGSDQVGTLGPKRWLTKCKTRAGARAQLLQMRDRAHTFWSAAAIVTVTEDGTTNVDGRFVQSATVHFVAFDDATLENFLDTGEWQGSCGGYRIEGYAARFISKVDGDVAAVWGMPLYPLVGALHSIVGA